ncbi:MAG: metallophosphatase family protein [Actinobacteria bacterium]|nr:metallophosphatase family protein [Actinomycetota bacterium]
MRYALVRVQRSPKAGLSIQLPGSRPRDAAGTKAGVPTGLNIHAGDVGAAEVLTGLSRIAPVTAVRGNMDSGALAWDLPQQAVAEVCGVRFLVEHDRAALVRAVDPRALGADVVVTGHSHYPAVEWTNRVLYLNPGAAGRRRFRLPKAVALVGLLPGKEGLERILPQIVVLEEGGSAWR